jgi:very-short-patch-repair endonuclease
MALLMDLASNASLRKADALLSGSRCPSSAQQRAVLRRDAHAPRHARSLQVFFRSSACHAACAGEGCARLAAAQKEIIMCAVHLRDYARSRPVLVARSHEMRWERATHTEQKLWGALRRRQLGTAFRRQVPIAGRYIVDFLAPDVRLVVEVDGGSHRDRRLADLRRDETLVRLGYRVLRVPAEAILRDPPDVLEQIRKALRAGRG